MDSPHSDPATIAKSLGDAARQGDWPRVSALVAALSRVSPPVGGEELGEYLDRLKEAMLATRIARAHLGTTLYRVAAAANFNSGRSSAPDRHDFAGPAGF